ncbi:hypothetical protein SDC9_21717 [bioreactor metagenome]|uniref:Uncharacterized protein n=1 Tax=bioreactor metagenome TaxID=1076179 RepID=A0A644UA75_9ZZZZ|nr:hypothetical protein [Candidatus Elulimicrobiales bacterium]
MEPKKQSFFKKYKKEIVIVIIAIFVFGSLFYFLFLRNKTNSSQNMQDLSGKPAFNFKNLLSFFTGDNKGDDTDGNNLDENIAHDYYFEGLIKIWDKPVAGYNFYDKLFTYKYIDIDGIEQDATSTKTILQFVDSETGFVYEKDLLAPTSSPYQVTITPFPNTVKAYFMNEKGGYKNRVFFQYLNADNTIKTVSATIPTYYGSTANLMNSSTLPDNIKNITTSQNNTRLAYIVQKNKKTGGKDDTYTDWYLLEDVNDSYGRRVYSSDLSSWKLILSNIGDLFAQTTDTAYENNTLYKVNIHKNILGDLSQLYGDHNGMFFLIENNNLLTSIFTGSGIKLYKNTTFNSTPFTDNDLVSLNFTTLANKCVQNNASNGQLLICSVPKEIINYDTGLPDAWYQGMTTWEDNFYVMSSDYPNGKLLFDIKKDGQVEDIIDAKNLNINSYKSHLGFINKNDGSLWTLNIDNILYSGGD